MNKKIQRRLENLLAVGLVSLLVFVVFLIGLGERELLQDPSVFDTEIQFRRLRVTYAQAVAPEMNEIALENRWDCTQVKFSYYVKSGLLDAVWAECDGTWREYKVWSGDWVLWKDRFRQALADSSAQVANTRD